MTQPQRLSWIARARNHETHYQSFIRLNIYRAYTGVTLLADPPPP